jgi:hypothetical protein
MASTVFLYLGAYFAFPMSKVWLSSHSTFVANYFLVGAAALAVGLQNFLALSILGLASNMSYFHFFSSLHSLEVFHRRKPVWMTVRGAVHGLLINNVEARY